MAFWGPLLAPRESIAIMAKCLHVPRIEAIIDSFADSWRRLIIKQSPVLAWKLLVGDLAFDAALAAPAGMPGVVVRGR